MKFNAPKYLKVEPLALLEKFVFAFAKRSFNKVSETEKIILNFMKASYLLSASRLNDPLDQFEKNVIDFWIARQELDCIESSDITLCADEAIKSVIADCKGKRNISNIVRRATGLSDQIIPDIAR